MSKGPGLFSDFAKKFRATMSKGPGLFSDFATMSKGPGLFSDFAKKSRDLLSKDYLTDQNVSIHSTTDSGIALSSNVAKNPSFGYAELEYKYMNETVGLKVDTDSNVLANVTITDLPTKTIASVKLPDYETGKLEVQYLHHHATFTTAVGLNNAPALDLSATVGTPNIAFGAEATYTNSGQFSKYNAGVSFTKADYNISAILADKGDSITASCLHYLPHLNGGAVVGEISRKFSTNENTLTVGCSYVVDPRTLLKAKLNNHGNLGAVLQHELMRKTFLTISGAFDAKALNSTPKVGFGLSLGLSLSPCWWERSLRIHY